MITINFNNNQSMTFNKDNTFADVRAKIREILGTKNKLRIKVLLDKPLRAFGKLNLEPGTLSPILSAAKLGRFNIKETLNLEVTVTDELFMENNKKINKSSDSSEGVYEISSQRQKNGMMGKNNEYMYKQGDFPPLS